MTEKTQKTDETGQALAALSAAGDVAYVWDVKSDALRWHGALEALEFDFASISLGSDFAARIHGDDRPLRDQRLSAHLGRKATFDCEYRLKLDHGGFAWFHDRGAAEPGTSARAGRVLGVLRLISGRKAAERRLEHLANYDELTGHFNKQRLREALDHVIASSSRSGDGGAYLAVGVDKLANINDAFGYKAADSVIIEIGQRLDRCLRVSDVIGRVGGDRFGIVLADCAEENTAIAAEKILAAVSQVPIDTVAGPVYATVSIGCATFPEQAKTAYDVMTRAETALAEAKRAGRDCFVSYRITEEQRRRHRFGMALGERVQRALKDDRLVFAYQPVVACRHRRHRPLRMPVAHDQRGRPDGAGRRFRGRDRAARVHPPDRPLRAGEGDRRGFRAARGAACVQHLGPDRDRPPVAARDLVAFEGQARGGEPAGGGDHRNRGAARSR